MVNKKHCSKQLKKEEKYKLIDMGSEITFKGV